MKTTERRKPVSIFVPITRVNEEQRTIEAYGFVNEVVEGEGGVRLKRTAMESATPDYMAWANIRQMHQPSAVGVADAVTWDEKGAHMTVRVVDEDAWTKVKAGVYKGLSVGVMPTFMRGKDVEKCTWFETSLVDRPKDPDAKILAFRAEGFDPEAESDVVVERSFADMVESLKKQDVQDDIRAAYYALCDCVWDCLYGSGRGSVDQGAELKQSITEFSDYLLGLVDENAEALRTQFEGLKTRLAGSDPTPAGNHDPHDPAPGEAVNADAITRRFETVTTEQQALLERFEGLAQVFAGVTRVEELGTQLTAAIERIGKLEKSPVALTPPVRYPHALKPETLARTFTSNEEDPATVERAQLETELGQLSKSLPNEADPKKRELGVTRMQVIKMRLQVLPQLQR